jgi:hypothetical protein
VQARGSKLAAARSSPDGRLLQRVNGKGKGNQELGKTRGRSLEELVEASARGDPSHWHVTIKEDPGQSRSRSLYLASACHADELQKLLLGAVRLDLQESLADARPTPEMAGELFKLIMAHACLLGEAPGDVIINCKSGKTRTPVVVIAYFLMKGVGPESVLPSFSVGSTRSSRRAAVPKDAMDEHIESAVATVANKFIALRRGVGIDFDTKMTGYRLLNGDKIAQGIVRGRLWEIREYLQDHKQLLPLDAPQNGVHCVAC